MGEGNQLFSDSFKSADVSEDDDIPVPANATCKLRAGCRQVVTYKSSISIACAQHATSDMKFTSSFELLQPWGETFGM